MRLLCRLLASGGAKSLADVQQLAATLQAQQGKLMGLVAGRAIYTGDLDFVQASEWLAQPATVVNGVSSTHYSLP